MDRSILMSSIMVFAGLLHTVLSTTLIRKEKVLLVERVNLWSRGIYPALLLVILVVSFPL